MALGDGAGGAFMTWGDIREYDEDISDVHVQHVSPSGMLLWGAGGRLACTAPGSQSPLGVVPDGGGGVLVAWSDGREQDMQIFAQRIDETGQPRWNPDGVPIFHDPGVQLHPSIVTDGSGGSIVIWSEKGGGGYEIRARRFGPDGSPLWPSVPVCESATVRRAAIGSPDG